MDSSTPGKAHPAANLMAQFWDDEWLDAAVRLEEESNCDISAGIDHGIHLGDYLNSRLQEQVAPLNRDRLLALLQTELGEQLSAEELEELVTEVQVQVQQRLGDKKGSLR